ncbi:hypothetical protein LCGC14_0458830 [marine sediment metagenome]|uniref:HNH nuclease domain-containing protein n=1 Tax=marine sediment metagenome TaxID=412755 RepID=A0A0F9SFR0_9ZZZZ
MNKQDYKKSLFLCGCGCKREVNWHRGKPNKYINGHRPRGKNFREKPTNIKPPLCKCGCKNPVNWYADKHTWRTFVNGHFHKGKKRPDLMGDKNPMSDPEVLAKVTNKNHHNWKGGISIEPYCSIWRDKGFKKMIRERDGNKCLNPTCRKTSKRLGGHHINYIKKDCNPWNIITICNSCNMRANYNREYWTKFYQNILSEKYGYKYE